MESTIVTLDQAIARYPVLTKRTLRRHISAGRLPASKPGRELLVSLADVERLTAPTLRTALTKPNRETPSERDGGPPLSLDGSARAAARTETAKR